MVAIKGSTGTASRGRGPMKVSDYLTYQIEACGKSQKQIADEIGYTKPNIITMLKQGLTKVPINKAGLLAKSLGVDPAFLLRMVMHEYMPETWDAIADIVGVMPTVNEQEMLKIIRDANRNTDPRIKTEEQRKSLRAWSKSL